MVCRLSGAAFSRNLQRLASSIAVLFGSVALAAPIELVRDGQSDYTILVEEGAAPAERFAAQELQNYFEQITGAKLPIAAAPSSDARIVIGAHSLSRALAIPSRFADDDSFKIKRDGAALFIKGATPRGTLFAVYAFLEQLGCRWFAPGVATLEGHHELIPHHRTLTLPSLDIAEEPLMRFRKRDADLGRRSHTASTWAALLSWMAKQRTNVFAISIDAFEKNRERLRDECARRGMILFVGQHALVEHVLSRAKYFSTHPDWFGLIDGRRTVRARGHPVMFETANADAVRAFHTNLVAYLRTRPEIDVVQLWPPDGALWSESPESTALGAPPDRMASLVNDTVRALRDAGLKTRVAFLAYSSFADPPRTRAFDPETILEFCPISQNPRFALRDARAPANAKYHAQLESWLDRRNRFPGAIIHYSYYAKYSWRSLPVVLPEQIAAEIQHWSELGETGTSLYCEPGNWLTLEANHLAFARASWDPHFAAARWFNEYLHDRFAGAADAMEKFYVEMSAISLDALIPQSRSIAPARARAGLEAARRALDEASAQAKSPDAQWFISRIAWQPDYLDLALKLREAELAGGSGANERAAIDALIAKHPNDGTMLDRGFGR
jgi:hypothetical protein